jgi:hypothetical protein
MNEGLTELIAGVEHRHRGQKVLPAPQEDGNTEDDADQEPGGEGRRRRVNHALHERPRPRTRVEADQSDAGQEERQP